MITILKKFFYSKCIPDILFYVIDKGLDKFLNLEELYNISIVNKMISYNCIIKKGIKRKKIYTYFENTFIPYSILERAEILDWNNKFIMIDYVDRIFIEDLKYPLMITVDKWKRPVLSIKYKYNNSGTYNGIITLFQRYSDNKRCWVKANIKGPFLAMSAMNAMSNKDKEIVIYNINNLLSGVNKIRINNFSQSYQGDYDFDTNLKDFNEINVSI